MSRTEILIREIRHPTHRRYKSPNPEMIGERMKPDSHPHTDVRDALAFAQDIAILKIVFVNVYIIGSPERWILVDTGVPHSAERIRAAAAAFLGTHSAPYAIILTHGHFDHAGSALDLAKTWDVPIYAHPLEMPYLTGLSDYPPPDPTVGGTLAFLSRVFPSHGYDFSAYVNTLPPDGSIPGLPEWRWIHTPGHTPGHISLFREEDQTLIAGDALATMNQESPVQMIAQERVLRWPPLPFTTDWTAARQSIERLADLWPAIIAAGHGWPMHGPHVAGELRSFSAAFTPPGHGRYVPRPAIADENGVVDLPPKPPDPVARWLAAIAIAGTGVFLYRRWRRASSRA
jgi:glyoxylase-like metal-dependent hydrolase (beta-lactamase superfamily II)